MGDTAIKVEGLGKKYVIGQQKSSDLRNAFGKKLKSLFAGNGSSINEEFWALQDINFEIKKGEAVGIIGRNGAGKSTLLKILSRITEPTKGRFEINGRVSSLLEVGTGFHPELTGRENIYLNGTILGMRRVEIRQKLDEIIAFSGVERFLDTPVKHYSSGMKVRLAFSVAAHLEPEILIIDEVLAVGDAEFQKKCLGKMDEVSKNEGRTVVFVSHNLGAVEVLCDTGVYLNSGIIVNSGLAETVIREYLKNHSNIKGYYQAEGSSSQSNIFIKEIRIKNELGQNVTSLKANEPCIINTTIINKYKEKLTHLNFAVGVANESGTRVLHLDNNVLGQCIVANDCKLITIDVNIPNLPLKPGKYILTFYLADNKEEIEWLKDVIVLEIVGAEFYKTGKLPRDYQYQFLLPYQYNISLDE